MNIGFKKEIKSFGMIMIMLCILILQGIGNVFVYVGDNIFNKFGNYLKNYTDLPKVD